MLSKKFVTDVEGVKLHDVHAMDNCAGRPCVIHAPSDHHMRGWRLNWRNDRGIFERICPHGIGHPDPDQFDYWRERDAMGEAVHGCDGCCQLFTNCNGCGDAVRSVDCDADGMCGLCGK